MKGKNVTPEFAKNVKLLLDKGLAPKDIIPIMNCSYQTIARIRDGVHPALYSEEVKKDNSKAIVSSDNAVAKDDMLSEMQQIRSALYLIADQIKKLNDTWN